MSVQKKKIKDFLSEYRYFLKSYLLPLIGIADNNIMKCNLSIPVTGTVYQDEHNYVYFSHKSRYVFMLKYSRRITEDNRSLAMNIIQCFFDISKFSSDHSDIARSNYSDVQQEAVYGLAIEKGICNWISSAKDNNIELLLNKLEKWSVQTYEGRNVTFGFLINPNGNAATPKVSWLDLLDNDMSAAFSDCIHSVMELDKDCNFCRFRSLSEGGIFEQCRIDGYSPLRFNNVIQKYVSGNVIGVFLLSTGDIIIAKNHSVQLVKRNMRWLNLSFDAFQNTVHRYISKSKLTDHALHHKLLSDIFSSILDVSFSHLGGIIAVVSDNWPGSTPKSPYTLPLLDPCDDLSGPEPSDTYRTEKKLSKKEFDKRIQKRRFIKCLVDARSFGDLDRKLRCELISLDGACILDGDGNVKSFGAIISNESGSSEGGRGAAAKTLSSFGLAAKVSTDGYVELYIDREIRYSIK